jgi:hypothetical protein
MVAHAHSQLLTNDAFLSHRFCCIPVYGVSLNDESRTEDFLFFVLEAFAGLTWLKETFDPCCDGKIAYLLWQWYKTVSFINFFL